MKQRKYDNDYLQVGFLWTCVCVDRIFVLFCNKKNIDLYNDILKIKIISYVIIRHLTFGFSFSVRS